MVFLSGVFLLGVTGCALLSAQIPLKGEGAQPKKSHPKTEKGIAKPDQKKRRPLNLKQAKADLKLALQKVELAELKMELSVLEMKLADYHQKIAEAMVRKAEIYQQCRKLEAGHKDGRVKKADDIDKLKALKTKSLDLESENIQTKAAIAKIDLDIQELKRKVDLHIKRPVTAAR
jgi:chromosome segregation ATPase